jgi:hypothetical protein
MAKQCKKSLPIILITAVFIVFNISYIILMYVIFRYTILITMLIAAHHSWYDSYLNYCDIVTLDQ